MTFWDWMDKDGSDVLGFVILVTFCIAYVVNVARGTID